MTKIIPMIMIIASLTSCQGAVQGGVAYQVGMDTALKANAMKVIEVTNGND